MSIKKHTVLFLLLSTLISKSIFSQSYDEDIFNEDIKSIEIQKNGIPLSVPILLLGSSDNIVLHFDELGDKIKSYRYKLLHCNQDWTLSDLSPIEYIEGFEEGSIGKYEFSFNTIQRYVHYSQTIPEGMSTFRVSGNYLLQVYDDQNPDEIAFSRKIYVYESLLNVSGKVIQSENIAERNHKQDVQVFLKQPLYNTIVNPKSNLTVVVKQNGITNNQHILKMYNNKGTDLEYYWSPENEFYAGNEFRNFDIKNIKARMKNVKSIDFFGGQNHVTLYPERNRSGNNYILEEDINGRVKYHTENVNNINTEGDYTWVHFTLPMDTPRIDGHFYIIGELTEWKTNNLNQMQYDEREKAYKLQLYLKQGYYNYLIGFEPIKTPQLDFSLTEGNHYETINEYIILVYYRQPGYQHDKIVGFLHL